MAVATLDKQLSLQELNSSIAPQHFEEWKKSAVSDEIINLAIRTIYDQLEVDKLLNRRLKKMWNRPTDLVPCWAVTGIDPLTDMPTSQGIQIKPATPRLNPQGKPIKYESARDSETAPLFLNTGKEGYWPSVLENVSEKLFITEGAKKAGCLLSNNYAGISIPGVSSCRKRGRLHQNLEIFAKVGRTFYLCFDNDLLAKKPVQSALKGMGAVLGSFGSVVMVVQLPPGEAKGVDDFIAANGAEEFQKLVDNALTIQEWVDEIATQESEEEEYQPKSKLSRHYHLIEEKWGDSLRYNNLKKQIELAGSELDEDEVRLTIANEFDIDTSLTDAVTIVRHIAKRDEYSPVVEYLNELAAKYPTPDTSFLDDLAENYFGSDDPIHAIYFKKFLIAAVARARNPGCKLDTVFMLQSPEQGKNKSTFFSVLFGKDYFSDQLGTDLGNKDEKMKISQYWCLEWAEFESLYRKKDWSALKNFITNQEDTFRAPYARKDARHPRPCVFVGTTNEKEVLHDPTGDRRFWIVPVTIDKIPLDLVRQDKDKIWAAADALYKSGYQWWLLDAEELIRAERNKEFQNISYWDEVIETLWCEFGRPDWLATEAIVKALGFESAKEMKPSDTSELNKSMTRLGFTKSKSPKRINGVQKRGWEFSQKTTKSEILTATPVTPVADAEKPCNESIPACDTPVTPPVTPVAEQLNIGDTILIKSSPVPEWNGQTDEVARIHEGESGGITTTSGRGFTFDQVSKCDKSQPEIKPLVKDIPIPPPIAVVVTGFFGESKAICQVTKIFKNGASDCSFYYEFADGSRETLKGRVGNRAQAESMARAEITQWEVAKMINPQTKYRVRRMGDDDFVWHENCTLPALPSPPVDCWYCFLTPELKTIRVAGADDFELMSG